MGAAAAGSAFHNVPIAQEALPRLLFPDERDERLRLVLTQESGAAMGDFTEANLRFRLRLTALGDTMYVLVTVSGGRRFQFTVPMQTLGMAEVSPE